MRTVMVEWFSLGEVVVVFLLYRMPCGVRNAVYTAGQDVGMPYYMKESMLGKHRTCPQTSRRYIHGCVSPEEGLR